MKGQKQFVVDTIKTLLPAFILGRDVALVMLTNSQLESLKGLTGEAIANGTVEYGKDRTKTGEVFAYARSMVMNHLKKAKELNGNQTYGKTTTEVRAATKEKATSNIDKTLLSKDLAEYVDTLV